MDRRLFLTALAVCAGATAGETYGQGRAWDQVVGLTVADRDNPHYRFSSFLVSSVDQKRRYWIQVGVPRRAPPARGYPAIYMLDGNAAMASITEADLAELDALSPPVLVAIGHDTHARNDVIARAYDYTPPVVRDGAVVDAVVRGRPGGGADIFSDLIEKTIKPRIETTAPIDHERQTLWGHSYGGLFALHILATRPGLYRNYAAGDPSIWWHDGVLSDEFDAVAPSKLRDRTVRIMAGGGRNTTRNASTPPGARPVPPPPPQPGRPKDTTRDTPPKAGVADAFVKRLRAAGVDATYEEFDGLNHGQMLPASLKPALRLAAR